MKKLNRFLHFVLFIALFFAVFSCTNENGGDGDSCKDKIADDWNSIYIESSGTDITDALEVELVLDDDGSGRITLVDLIPGGSGTTSADISDWEVDTDCENLEFTDESGGGADMKIVRLTDDELELDGVFYGFQFEIKFERD